MNKYIWRIQQRLISLSDAPAPIVERVAFLMSQIPTTPDGKIGGAEDCFSTVYITGGK